MSISVQNGHVWEDVGDDRRYCMHCQVPEHSRASEAPCEVARRFYGPRTCCELTNCPVWGDEYLTSE